MNNDRVIENRTEARKEDLKKDEKNVPHSNSLLLIGGCGVRITRRDRIEMRKSDI